MWKEKKYVKMIFGKKVNMNHIPDYYEDPSKEAIPVSKRLEESKKEAPKKDNSVVDKINEEYKKSLITTLINGSNNMSNSLEEYANFLMNKSIEELENMVNTINNNFNLEDHSSKGM